MEEKGDQLMAEGDKSLKKFSLFSSSDDKYDKAHEKYLQAATQYKAAGNFTKVAGAYKRASEASRKNKNEMDYATELEEAGRALIKAGDPKGAKEAFSQAVDVYDAAQKFNNAAKACTAVGEITVGDESMQWLAKAVKYYRTQGSKVTANEIVVKMADSKARSGDYAGALAMYDQLGREALDDHLSRGNARKLLFNALLAQIANMSSASLMEDVGVLEERFDEYQELDTQFNVHTREHMLITAIIDAIHNEDAEAYEEAIREYDNIVPLDETREKMLLKGLYSPTVLADAIHATTAVAQSVSGAAPDWVPSMTILRADPLVGFQYLYESVLPDSNHVISQSSVALRAPGSASWSAPRPLRAKGEKEDDKGGESRHGTEEDSDDEAWSVTQAFRARSPLYMQECLQALAQPPDAAALTDRHRSEPWGCLAGALLSALCYMNQHGLNTPTGTSGATTTTGVVPRTVVLVFSDGDASPQPTVEPATARAALTFADECAFAVAAVQLSKTGTPLFAFGEAVAASAPKQTGDGTQTVPPPEDNEGGARLHALATSLGGFTAPRFSFAHVGVLLDTHSDEALQTSHHTPHASTTIIPTNAVVHDVDAASDPLSLSKQCRRERLVDHYVLRPVMLPLTREEPAPTKSASRKRTRASAAERVAATAAASTAYMGWLCPHCTAVVQRSASEVIGSSAAPMCPYCCDENDD